MSALFQADRSVSAYQEFFSRLAAEGVGRAREDEFRSLTELQLQSLWFAGAFGRRFRSTCGRDVFVRQFGHWNRSAGPDFSDVSVVIDQEEHAGAIELDRDVRDWEHHGHSENPDYENLVLHVFFSTGTERFFTRTLANREVVQVQLSMDECQDTAGLF